MSHRTLGATLTGGAVGGAFLGGTANAADSTTVAADGSSSTASDTGAGAATPAADATTPAAPADGQRGPGGQGGTLDPSKGGHQANGMTEAILTGDTADKVTAAAAAAVPGATVERVETDAEGATYEAHIVKSDGSHVTVKLGADVAVSSAC